MTTFQLVAAQRGAGAGQAGLRGSLNCQGSGDSHPVAISSPIRECKELTKKGFTPRHYFRHNIRPVHTIKQ